MGALTLFGREHDAPRHLVARRGAAPITRDELLGDVAALARELEVLGPGRWLLSTECTYACAVGLLALWQSGCVAVLPPNHESGTLNDLGANALGLITDRESATSQLRCVAALGRERPNALDWREIDADAQLLELCTSGSTGARKVVGKTLRQLESEIQTLERVFGTECGDAQVLGTVSHQHIYGLLFRVLWPLCMGRAFVAESVVDPAQLVASLASNGENILISSPAHLARLPKLLDLARLRGRCGAIFSSGGALDDESAAIYAGALGRAPIEVFGSTETGGIAWRRRSGLDDSGIWSVFENVKASARDGVLCVSSPCTGGATVVTGDLVAFIAPQRFELLGRADRIVKLFEERVSLVEIESRLREHPSVADVAALVIERGGAPRIGVVVALTTQAWRASVESSRAQLISELRGRLAPFFRATALPRAWRVVESIPQDALGKRSVATLQALFVDSTARTSANALTAAKHDEREFSIELEVPHDLCFFRGHFEGLPIVPGVVELAWVLDWAREWLGFEITPREVRALKFKQLLRPGERFHLHLDVDRERAELDFRLANDSAEFSSGRILFGPL